MRVITFAVAIAPEAPLAATELIRLLRERQPEAAVLYPAAAEVAMLGALLRAAPLVADAPLVASTGELDLGSWLKAADFLLVPRVTPTLLPTIQRALAQDIPVIAPRSPLAEEALGFAGVLPDTDTPLGLLEAALRLEQDPAEREAISRRARVQLRHLDRLVPGAAPDQADSPAGPVEVTSGPGVSVLIPTRGGSRVRWCVQCLHQAAGAVPLQVVLIATGGLDGELPACDDVVRCEPAFCWSKANNAGLAVIRHPYVLLLNDDCYFQGTGDLQRLVERLERCGHLVAVAPRGSGFPSHWEQSTLAPGAGLRETRFTLCGACFLVRREAFWSVGRFDERFTSYGCDEMDWFYRARGMGYRWAIDADVSVEHEGTATYGAERRERELPHSSALFQEIHGVPDVDGPHWDPPRCAVSWVIASRNNAGHLARCLGSIAAQRHLYPPGPEGMEVVLALDGCTDASAAVAEAFNTSLPEPLPLRVVSFPEPAGSPAGAKNRALRLARGEVILPMDDDDAALPGRAQLVSLLLEGRRGGRVDVAVGDFWVIGLDGSVAQKQVGPIRWSGLLRGGAQNWGLWATAIRRETLARYGLLAEDRVSTEDLDLWLRWLRDGVRFRHIPVPAHLYLLRPGSIVFRHDTLREEEEIRRAYRSGEGTRRLGLQTACPYRLRGAFAFPPEVRFEPWGKPGELAQLLARFRHLQPRRILEIGTARGGTLREWLDHAPDGAVVVSVDLPPDGRDYREVFRAWVPAGVRLHCLHADSHDPATRAKVTKLLPAVDFLFIDGDHRYEGVKQDYEEYGRLVRPGGMIVLHDIVPAPAHPEIEVPRFWTDLCRALAETATPYETLIEDPGQEGCGIGVVYVPAGPGKEPRNALQAAGRRVS